MAKDDDKLAAKGEEFLFFILSKLGSGPMRVLPIVTDIPDSHAAIVGRIMATWSYVEWSVRVSVYKLLGIGPKEGRIAVRDPRLEDQITMIQQLLSLRKLTIKSNLSTIQTGLRLLASYRDMLAHGLWLQNEKGELYVQQLSGNWQPQKGGPKVSRRISPEGVLMEPEGLNNLLVAMKVTLHLVDKLSDEIDAALRSLPQKSPRQSSPDGQPHDPKSNIP